MSKITEAYSPNSKTLSEVFDNMSNDDKKRLIALAMDMLVGLGLGLKKIAETNPDDIKEIAQSTSLLYLIQVFNVVLEAGDLSTAMKVMVNTCIFDNDLARVKLLKEGLAKLNEVI